MAGLKKDVELIFRGTDRATPTIKDVRKGVADLTGAIQDQIAAAERGEGTIDDLAKVYKRLQAAQGDVTEITKLATAYDNLVRKHAEQAEKADLARQKEAQLAAQIAGAEAPTKRLINARDAATRSAEAAARKEEELAQKVRLAATEFEAAGGEAKNFAASQEAIRAAALETATALGKAGAAMDGYKAAQAKGASAQAAIQEAGQFNAMAAGSGLPQAQIAFISGLENRIEALSAAMRENQASANAMNAAIANQAANLARDRIAGFKVALDEAEQSAIRLANATQLKNQAAGLEAAARDVARFGGAADTGAASAQRLVDAIQGIISPTTAAARSLDGVFDVIGKAEATLEGTKRRISEYNLAINDLAAANAGLIAIARDIDAFRAQEAAVAGAEQAFRDAQQEALQYAQKIRQASEPTAEMARESARLEAALTTAGNALKKEQAALGQLEGKLEAANVDTRNLAAAQEQLTAAAGRAAAAQTTLAGKTGGKGSFLGLNPNEMQNLGFQINDVVVSLISGQKPLTVLVQQGAQIGQIFPGAFSAIAAFLPIIIVVGAALAVVVGAMSKVADEGRRLDQARNNLASMAEVANGLNVTNIAALAKGLEDAGLSAEEANTKMREFLAEGLGADQIQQYTDAAKAAAQVTGVEFADALDTVTEAFSGGMDAIYELDAATNAYTDTEIAMIEQLFEQGRADEARANALTIYSNKMNEVAADSEGKWATAVGNLGTAWDNLLTSFSQTYFFENARAYLRDLAGEVVYFTALLAGKGFKGAAADRDGVGKVAPRTNVKVADPNRRTAGGQAAIREQNEALRAARATTAAQKRAIAGEKAYKAAIDDKATSAEAAQAKALAMSTFDAQESQRAAGRAKKGGGAAKKRQREAESAAKAIERSEEQLARALEALDSKVAKTQTESLETRLGAIDSEYAKLFRQIDEYSAKTAGKGLIGGQTITEVREQIKSQQQILKNYETLEFREKQLNGLLKERGEKLDAIQDKVARGLISPEQGLNESDAVIGDIAKKVNDLAADAIVFATSMRGATPNPTLEAFISKFQAAAQNNSGDQNVRESRSNRMDAINTAEQGLNQIIQQRNALVENENLLVQLGLQNRSQAQAKIEAQYARTSALIRSQINNVRALAASFAGDADPAMRLYFDNLTARLDAADVQADYLDANFTQMKGSIDNLLTSNIVGFIDSVASSFADLVTGQSSVLGFFASIGRAFLDMIAKTLQGIAMLILQMIILDTVEKFTGIPVKALLKLYGGAGVFHSGGVAKNGSNRQRQVSPLMFANAPRYHTGGIAGMAPDEVGAILKKNEEVLTKDDPRHRFNGGLNPDTGGGGKMQKAVLAVGDEQIAAAMVGSAGEEVTMFHLRRNKQAIKQMLDN